MARARVLLVALLVVCIVVEELEASRRNRTRTRNRNRNRNRTRNRGQNSGSRPTGGKRTRPPLNTCEEITVPMCKGLIGYNRTVLPNRFNHTTQLQVYRVLEHIWALIDRGCSKNFRLLACALFLPKCTRRGRGREPCLKTCKKTKRVCEPRLEQFGYTWPEVLDCSVLPRRRCLKLGPHETCNVNHMQCDPIDLPMCQGIGFETGMSPNMFGQCSRAEIATEMDQFRPLVASQCSPKLGFFLCGVYMPFCTNTEHLLSFPCQELCTEVRGACESTYLEQTGLPWPNKFQCHRYPLSTNENYTCVMPDEGPALGLNV